jgi:glycosyltransferase involved in cell wall biosynthesis
MRSVFFISLMNSDAWGGSEEIWFHSAIHLAQKGTKVHVCCFNWPGKEKKFKQLSEARCELHLLPGRQEAKSFLQKLKLKVLVRNLPVENCDEVIINQGGWKDVVHGPLQHIYKRCRKYSLVYHNYDREKLSPAKAKLFQQWVSNAKANIGDAARIFSVITEVHPITIPNQQVLFNPIGFGPPRDYTGFPPSGYETLQLIVLAQLDIKRKGQDLLIKAFANEKWKTRNWQLYLYGKGNDADILAKMIVQANLQDKVFLKGYAQDIAEVLARSHALLQLTHIDAMPISVIEAMAMSRAVVASDVGDMPLWIKNDVNGWIANDLSVKGIDTVLEKLWQDRGRLEAMGRESFNIFTKKYPADPISYFLNIAGINTNKA